MRALSGNQIREDFLRFFEGKGHRRVHSSSLIPANDPTLLFTNAGMNQFKDVFLGAERRDYARAASSQKCVRAGGKHNDLENVGFTRRHHTFFEMLGNFSFGDYFKREAIAFAWELLTSPDWFGIDKSRLYVTIFEGSETVPRDDEAEGFWIETGVPKERIFPMPGKDNFWQMGDTGPCGPCSEIFYDLGLEAAEQPGVDKPFPQDDQRYVEIWNLVFMQFDRASDGTLSPLPKQSVDTGMGLERIAAVLQGKLSNYESDLFTPLIAAAARLTGFRGGEGGRGGKAADLSTALTGVSSGRDDGGVGDAGASGEGGGGKAAGLSTALTGVSSGREDGGVGDAGASGEGGGKAAGLSTALTGVSSGRDDAGVGEGGASGEGGGGRAAGLSTALTGVSSGRDDGESFGSGGGVGGEKAGATSGSSRPEAAGRSGESRSLEAAAIDRLAVSDEKGAASLRIIADHARAATFLISDGLLPSNEHRGYVLRKILRRGIRHGRLLGQEKPFMYEMVFAVRDEMQAAYPELKETAERVSKVVLAEEQQFARTLELGLRQMNEEVLRSGRESFRLYETFGMPMDFMVDAARDAGIAFDTEGFERAMQEEQARARASWKGGSQKSAAPVYRELSKTEFVGYGATRMDGARVLALVREGVGVQELKPGEIGEVVLDATSFYADSGGQVGDVGWLYASDHHTAVAEVTGCRKPVQGVFAHQVVVKHPLAVGDSVDTVVNAGVRHATMRNHTGTHLLHAALREVLGRHVKQAGSLNDAHRLRFDFNHFTGVGPEEMQEIEDLVNTQVLANTPVETMVDVPIDVAVHELGATALFGEKYGEYVRVVKIGDFSTELCGGTHTAATGEIGLLKLVGESSVSSGVRRVEAVSGTGSLSLFRRDAEVARVASQVVGGELSAEALQSKLAQSDEELKKLRRELEQMRMKSASAANADAASSAVEVSGVKVLARRVDALDKSQMRNLVDELRGKLGSGVVVLGAATPEGKVSLIAGVTKDLTGRVQAGKIVGQIAAKVGGKGGGRPDLAEAGGSDAAALDGALASAVEVVGALLG